VNQDLETITDTDYSEQRVRIDARHFINCNFRNSILVWNGDTAMQTGCILDGCRIEPEGKVTEFLGVLQSFHFKVERIYPHP
jgi:hypothetical protein